MTGDAQVLVVDDDEAIRTAVVDALEVADLTVATAAHGAEALDLLRASNRLPFMILLDVMMPVMDGYQFLAELRKDPRLAGISVVVFSAYGKPAEDPAALQAQAVVAKPLSLADLLALVERFQPIA